LHPILLHESVTLQGKSTVVVASAAVQAAGFVTVSRIAQAGTVHVLQTVPVAVRVGQLTAELHSLVVIWMKVAVLILTLVTVAIVTPPSAVLVDVTVA
jgi:hypothetical protein